MPTEVIMPKVDMDMSSGRIAGWHAVAGDRVEKGAPLFDIETDKAAMEVEAPDSGILQHPVAAGVDVPIGEPVAWLYGEGEEVEAPPSALPARTDGPLPSPEPVPREGVPDKTPPTPISVDGLRATPLARTLAREAGLDLRGIEGTGPRGRVQALDARAAREARDGAATIARSTTDPNRLAVTRSRDGTGTPMVLLHGFAADGASWAPLEAYLDDRPIIRIELPCHGRSPTMGIPDFAALASEIRTAFDGLHLDEAHLIGHSLGAALTLALADTRPRSVSGLTLIAPCGLGPDINGAALHGIGRATRTESLGPWLKSLVADEALITDDYVRAAMATRRDPERRKAQQALLDALVPDGVQAFDLKAALRRLEMPARILWGREDEIIPWRHALQAPGRVGLHLLEGVGHMPHLEAPEDVGKIVRLYL